MNRFHVFSQVLLVVWLVSGLLPFFQPITASNWSWSPDLIFDLPAYNSAVCLVSTFELDNFTWNDRVNASILTLRGMNKPSYIAYQIYNLTSIYNVSTSTLVIDSSEGSPNQNYTIGLLPYTVIGSVNNSLTYVSWASEVLNANLSTPENQKSLVTVNSTNFPSYVLFLPYNSCLAQPWQYLPEKQFTISYESLPYVLISSNTSLTSLVWASSQLKVNASTPAGNKTHVQLNSTETPSYVLYVQYNVSLAQPWNYYVSEYFVMSYESLMLNMRYHAIKNGTLADKSENGLLRRLGATITNIENKATVQIYTNGYRPRYVKVGDSYTTEWTWNRTTSLLTFNATAASDRDIEAIFGITDEEVTTTTALGASMGTLAALRKRISKNRKWIERALIIAFIITILVLAFWIAGIYAGWF